MFGETPRVEENNREEAEEAFEAEAAAEDHDHVQDQPEQVLGGVGGGVQGHDHHQGAAHVAGGEHGGRGAAEQRELGEGEVETSRRKAGPLCFPVTKSSTITFLLPTLLLHISTTSALPADKPKPSQFLSIRMSLYL